MTLPRNGEHTNQENQQCSTYLFPPSLPPPTTVMSGDLMSVVSKSSASHLTSLSRGHARSASHGGVGASLSASTSSSVVSRPSALKQGGHQRAFSQGQIVDSAGLTRGHSRVGSRTDFILPPGHRDTESTPTSNASLRPTQGHSRQASRSESIYTLRHSHPPSLLSQLFSFVFRRGLKNGIEDQPYRTVVPNHVVPPSTPKKNHPNGLQPDNRIRTTKYTLLSFLPKNLLEQLHRVANVYFICIVLLNWVPAINAFGKEIAMLPVLFVLGVTAIKDLFEDRRRHASDKRINNSTCRVYKSEMGRYTKVLWKDVQVGDLIHLSNNEVIPADVLLLRTSNPNGLAYLDTCNLDGETNLKQRQVARGYLEKQDIFEPSQFVSVVEVDRPTTKIYRFHGAIIHPSGERVSVNTDSLLLRECMLKNTDFVEGIVVYAGHETKAMLNNGGPRYKRSTLERQMNIDVIWCVVILLVLCVVGAFGCKLWLSSYEGLVVPFIPYASDPIVEGMLSFWTFVIILQVMIPLSLYVTMEMAKLLQVYHIHNDIGMYDPETNKRVECRALNIPEQLGQVEYIFSDKTGTLTENKMVFRRCTIAGVDYNHPPPANAQNLRGLNTSSPMPLLVNQQLQEELTEAKLLSIHSQRVQEFLLVLALCNTVVVARHPHHDMMNSSGVIENPPCFTPTVRPSPKIPSVETDRYTRLAESSRSNSPSPPGQGDQGGAGDAGPDQLNHSSTKGQVKRLNVPTLLLVGSKRVAAKVSSPSQRELKPIYEAESPDELALVHAAHSYGMQLMKHTPQLAAVLTPGEGLVDHEILQVLPFDSTRKCMSVVVRHPVTRAITLYCKGADSTIIAQLSPTEDAESAQLVSRTQQHLNAYARQGLRVLVMAKRSLTETEFNEWQKLHEEGELAHDNHERRKLQSYAAIETKLVLLGATGIEDRLQEGVPETIAALINAGIVIWVLTGDKPETAINVAYSARLFSPQMELLKLFARSKETAEATIMFYLTEIEAENSPESVEGGVFSRATLPQASRVIPRRTARSRALVVDGKTLTYILDRRSNLQKPFLALAQACNAVLCCRATPLQKAFIVRTVKTQLNKRTLAIGDGANDVSMIQTADIGVGISGQEGMQAVMAADFALSRFKYLERFLLVHGHWCYDRLARMVLYFFYKNATFVFLIFWYQLYCGFSGAVMIDQMYLMLYNLLFTSLPPIAIGVYDKDVPAEILLSQPSLYRQGRLGLVYQPHSFWLTMADSMYQSIVIFFVTEGAYHDSDVGIWEFGTTITTACMFVMLAHVAIEVRSWTIIHVASIVASLMTYYAFSIVYNTFCLHCFGLPSNYWVVQKTMGSSTYWLVIFLAVVLALLPRFVVRGLEHCLYPNDATRAMLDRRAANQRGEDFLVSWSRSTSTSSIYRTSDYASKTVTATSLTVVG